MKIHYYYYYYSGGLFCIMTRAADPQSVLYNGSQQLQCSWTEVGSNYQPD